ncbi:hypothetical protein LCGC14_0889020 [marine sediment metagenome]|uniref:Uncharacterized protein n=1 Tax=marine sediment metagenome TaxID=412755 RepID=A0A0F9NZU1_9ZZZZ
MFYKIVEVSTDKASGHTYVLVHFWRRKADQKAGKPPDRINDFLMQLRPTGERVVTNAQGWLKRKDGVFVDLATLGPEKPEPEWERETFDRDLPAEIKANIEAYWERAEAKGYPPDHANASIRRDNSDPHGVLARPDVVALRGKEVDRA